jgi:hypothetical protein
MPKPHSWSLRLYCVNDYDSNSKNTCLYSVPQERFRILKRRERTQIMSLFMPIMDKTLLASLNGWSSFMQNKSSAFEVINRNGCIDQSTPNAMWSSFPGSKIIWANFTKDGRPIFETLPQCIPTLVLCKSPLFLLIYSSEISTRNCWIFIVVFVRRYSWTVPSPG